MNAVIGLSNNVSPRNLSSFHSKRVSFWGRLRNKGLGMMGGSERREENKKEKECKRIHSFSNKVSNV